VLVSAFVFGGIPEKAVKKAFLEGEIFVSPSLLKEYRDVPLALNAVGKIDHVQLKVLVSGIASFVSKAGVVYPQTSVAICRDMGDNMLLECCLAARADFLITGDKDLLTIENLPFEVRILTPRRYVEEG
jgi:putative PIN family toxin of toxin-antitoxin system